MLAVIAGEGALPPLLFAALDARNEAFHLCEMDGHPCDKRGDRPVIRFRVEQLGSFISDLKSLGVSKVCMAGKMQRPPLDVSQIDEATKPLVPRFMTAMQQGDDALLRTVLGFFEERQIFAIGAHELRPDLLPEPGVLSEAQPADHHTKDAQRGAEIIAAMAQVDVGQACIVSSGQALAIEALPGTDWMMQSLMAQNQPLNPDLLATDTGQGGVLQRSNLLPPGGVLVKAAKPGQELRVDMPVIGPDTVRRAVQLQLDGIVIEAGRVMMLDTPRCVEIANKHDLFLWVRA
ncbi:MAG: UDP-2,3-diacylglucosamine diphosphatase LpxI [Pseudomonadota bacterium]